MRKSRYLTKLTLSLPALLGLLHCGPGEPPASDDMLGLLDGPDEVGEREQQLVGACTASFGTFAPAVRQPTLAGGVTLVANPAACHDGVAAQYRFTASSPTGQPLVLCNWQAGTTCNWNTASLTSAGRYQVTVETRRAGQTAAEGTASKAYDLGPSCTAATVAIAPSPRVAAGAQVTFTATATCDAGTSPRYSFAVYSPGGLKTELGARSQLSNQAVWNTLGAAETRHQIQVYVQPFPNQIRYQPTGVNFVEVGNLTCANPRVSVTGTGDVRTITSIPEPCSPGATPEYRYVQVAPNGAETVLQDWSTVKKVSWNVVGLDGVYRVRLEARAAQNPTQTPATHVAQVYLGTTCTSPALVGFGSSYPKSGPVPLRAEATCPSPEFRFLARPNTSATWTDACGGWKGAGGCDWAPPAAWGAGTYEAQVLVRTAGATAVAFESQSVPQSFALGDDADGDGYTAAAGDCDDGDASVNPGAAEVCNGADENCDGQADEGVTQTFYGDGDGDGYGSAGVTGEGCSAPAGYVSNKDDCDDKASSAHPGGAEVCGNAVDEDCDGGDQACAPVSPDAIVFTSSATYTGNLGGLSGADAKCQGLAQAAHLTGTFRALLSDSSNAAGDRLTRATGVYKLVNGTVVASSADTFFSGQHAAAIDRDEAGNLTGGEVWTGTSGFGGGGGEEEPWDPWEPWFPFEPLMGGGSNAGGYLCDDWTSTDGTAMVGLAHVSDSTWLSVYDQWCNRNNVHLYCVQQ